MRVDALNAGSLFNNALQLDQVISKQNLWCPLCFVHIIMRSSVGLKQHSLGITFFIHSFTSNCYMCSRWQPCFFLADTNNLSKNLSLDSQFFTFGCRQGVKAFLANWHRDFKRRYVDSVSYTGNGLDRNGPFCVIARIPAMSGMCSWKALVIGEQVPGRPRTKNGTPRLHYLFVLLGTKQPLYTVDQTIRRSDTLYSRRAITTRANMMTTTVHSIVHSND